MNDRRITRAGKILILFFLVAQISCKNEPNLLEKEWILVYEEYLDTGTRVPASRYKRFRFKENQLRETLLIRKAANNQNYELENNEIKLDEVIGKTRYYLNGLLLEELENVSFSGKVIHLTNDSLVIQRNEEFLSVYKPLKQTNLSLKDAENLKSELLENIWDITTKEDTIRFYCNNREYPVRFDSSNQVKCISYEDTRVENPFNLIFSGEYWTIDFFDGKILVIYSFGYTENQILQITEIKEKEMIGELLPYMDSYNWETVKITKANIPQKLKKLEKKDLVGKWSCEILNKNKNGVITYSTSTEPIDSFQTELIINPTVIIYDERLRWHQKGRINLNDVKNDNLTFLFEEDGNYEIKANQKLIRTGNNWGLTKDKKYIYLDEPMASDNFIELINFEENAFYLDKTETIGINEKSLNPCFDVVLNLKLTRDGK